MKDRKLNKEISSRILLGIAEKKIEAAQVMKELNIPSSSFYNSMNSVRDWTIDNLIAIAEYFDWNLDYLIKGVKTNETGAHVVKEDIYKLKAENLALQEEVEKYRSAIAGIADTAKSELETKRKEYPKIRKKRKE